MENSGNNIVLLPTGGLKLTGFAPTVTVTPTKITEAIESNDKIADAAKFILKDLLKDLYRLGKTTLEEFINSNIPDSLTNFPESWDAFIKMFF